LGAWCIGPNPQSPIPNPQLFIHKYISILTKLYSFIENSFKLLKK